jgi:hypothetical protein
VAPRLSIQHELCVWGVALLPSLLVYLFFANRKKGTKDQFQRRGDECVAYTQPSISLPFYQPNSNDVYMGVSSRLRSEELAALLYVVTGDHVSLNVCARAH